MSRALTASAVIILILAVMGVRGLFGTEAITQEEARTILRELKEIRALLGQMARPEIEPSGPTAQSAKVKVAVNGSHSLGRDDAPLTLVEFTDYQCPFCSRFHTATFDKLKKNYIDTAKLRYVSRDLPLSGHRHAFKAARAARCAGEQGRFWELRHLFLVNAHKLSEEAIQNHAQALSLDMSRFRFCLDGSRYVDEIRRDVSDARAAGINGTPTFILGKTARDGVEGIKIIGAQPYAAFETKIKELLEERQ